METLEEISYGLALRALGQQERALGELRARTGSLLTASSLIASFLGAQAIARSGLSVFVVAGLVALGASLALTIYVLVPRRGLEFAVDGHGTYEWMFPFRDDSAAVHVELASWLDARRLRNRRVISRSTSAFRLASLGVIGEIAFFTLSLAIP